MRNVLKTVKQNLWQFLSLSLSCAFIFSASIYCVLNANNQPLIAPQIGAVELVNYVPALDIPKPTVFKHVTEPKPKSVQSKLIEVELPDISTKSYMFTDYRTYNIPGSPHNRLQSVSYTDENGLRRYGEDYIVAMGSYYSTSVGDRFLVKLENGNSFTIIFGDGKWDSDLDSKHMYMPAVNYDGETVGNLLEFIIDKDALPADVYSYGGLEKMKEFNSDIKEMYYIGRDSKYDWDSWE